MLLNVHRKTVVNKKKLHFFVLNGKRLGKCWYPRGNSSGILTGEPRNISSGIHAKSPNFRARFPAPIIPGEPRGNGRGRGRPGPCCMYGAYILVKLNVSHYL